MFLKVAHNKQVHIYNAKQDSSFAGLKTYIKNVFNKLPSKYQLYYLDQENDQITLANEEDFKTMTETVNRAVKIFIKEVNQDYYDQTQKVVLDDQFIYAQEQMLVQNSSKLCLLPLKDEKDNDPQIIQINGEVIVQKSLQELHESQLNEDIDAKLQIPSNIQKSQEKMPQFNYDLDQSINESQMSHVTEASIEQKIQQLYPNFVQKIKQQLLKDSMKKSQIKFEKKQNQLPKKVVHLRVTCDVCKKDNIEGVRYKCSVCADFDVCEVCEVNFEHPHPFLKIKYPKQAPHKIFTILDSEQESCQINGNKIPMPNVPCMGQFLGNIFNPQKHEQFFKGFQQNVGPFFQNFKQSFEHKEQNKQFEKKPEPKVQEKPAKKQVPVKQKIQVPVAEKKKIPFIEKKQIPKKEEPEAFQQKNDKVMNNAFYLCQVLDLDYNRCYKFAKKHQKLSKQELLQLYFANPKSI